MSLAVGQNEGVLGGPVSESVELPEVEGEPDEIQSSQLLVEEVSIDGLCGVY